MKFLSILISTLSGYWKNNRVSMIALVAGLTVSFSCFLLSFAYAVEYHYIYWGDGSFDTYSIVLSEDSAWDEASTSRLWEQLARLQPSYMVLYSRNAPVGLTIGGIKSDQMNGRFRHEHMNGRFFTADEMKQPLNIVYVSDWVYGKELPVIDHEYTEYDAKGNLYGVKIERFDKVVNDSVLQLNGINYEVIGVGKFSIPYETESFESYLFWNHSILMPYQTYLINGYQPDIISIAFNGIPKRARQLIESALSDTVPTGTVYPPPYVDGILPKDMSIYLVSGILCFISMTNIVILFRHMLNISKRQYSVYSCCGAHRGVLLRVFICQWVFLAIVSFGGAFALNILTAPAFKWIGIRFYISPATYGTIWLFVTCMALALSFPSMRRFSHSYNLLVKRGV